MMADTSITEGAAGGGGEDSGADGMPGVSWEEGEKLDYATIAKAGGRRDLLYHFDNVRDPDALAATWPRTVDWFEHPSPPPRQRMETYHSHLNEHWSQWDTTTSSRPFELPGIPEDSKKTTSATRDQEDVKLPPITQRDDVDFGRLLSLDYQREWLHKKEEKEKLQKLRAKERKLAQRKKLQKHCMKARMNLVKPEDLPEQQKRYIMKRFARIPSKVKLPPIDP